MKFVKCIIETFESTVNPFSNAFILLLFPSIFISISTCSIAKIICDYFAVIAVTLCGTSNKIEWDRDREWKCWKINA